MEGEVYLLCLLQKSMVEVVIEKQNQDFLFIAWFKKKSRVSLSVTSICPRPVLDLIPSDSFKH